MNVHVKIPILQKFATQRNFLPVVNAILVTHRHRPLAESELSTIIKQDTRPDAEVQAAFSQALGVPIGQLFPAAPGDVSKVAAAANVSKRVQAMTVAEAKSVIKGLQVLASDAEATEQERTLYATKILQVSKAAGLDVVTLGR